MATTLTTQDKIEILEHLKICRELTLPNREAFKLISEITAFQFPSAQNFIEAMTQASLIKPQDTDELIDFLESNENEPEISYLSLYAVTNLDEAIEYAYEQEHYSGVKNIMHNLFIMSTVLKNYHLTGQDALSILQRHETDKVLKQAIAHMEEALGDGFYAKHSHFTEETFIPLKTLMPEHIFIMLIIAFLNDNTKERAFRDIFALKF